MKLETTRLLIRQWTLDDIDPYFQIISDPQVARFLGDGRPKNYEDASDFVHRAIARAQDRGWIVWAVGY